MADAGAVALEQFDLLANVKPVVIPGAHLLQDPMITLGVFCNRIKDRP